METCKIYYCYKATNTANGKVYIGFATDPKTRWRNHRRDAETNRGFALASAIRKHGWDAFEFEILCCGKDRQEMLKHVEPLLIEQYQSRIDQNGYNVTRGGEHIPVGNRGGSKKGRVVSEESRLRMRAAKQGNRNGAGNKGRTHSEATKQKMTISHMGHIVTEETRRKIGEGHKRRHDPESRRTKTICDAPERASCN